MDLDAVMRTTGAVRRFTGEPLPDDVLRRILDRARFAPTGGNRQGTHVVVVRDRGTREALMRLSVRGAQRYLAQQRHGETGWNPLRPPTPDDDEIAATEVPAAMTAPLLEAAVVLVVGVDLAAVAATDQDLDRIGIVGGASVYPFVWNVLLAARDEGFGGVLTTMAVAEEPAVRELLRMPDEMAVAAVVPLGRPLRQVRRLTRRPVSEFVTRERFDGESL